MSTTSILTNSVRGRYVNKYGETVYSRRLYDQFCYPISEDREILQRNTSITVPFLSGMSVGSTAISETVDITPQTLRDTTASLTPSSRGEAIQDSELLLLQAYTDYGARRFKVLAENMVETVEAYLLSIAMAGANVSRPAARASLDAGTTSHEFSHKEVTKAKNDLLNMRCPMYGQESEFDSSMISSDAGIMSVAALAHPDVIYDLTTNTPIVEVAEYQQANIILNGEIGMIDGVRIVSSPFAKVFGGAGVDNGSSAATTLSNAENALQTVITVASASNASSGRYLTVGTEETGTTLYPMNERVKYGSESGTDLTIVGMGPNGGLKYDHASGEAVRNADSVYPVLFGGPMSIAKAYATEVGEFGQVVGPKLDGLADQFVSLAWKWYGGFAIINQNWLVRGEYASSLDA